MNAPTGIPVRALGRFVGRETVYCGMRGRINSTATAKINRPYRQPTCVLRTISEIHIDEGDSVAIECVPVELDETAAHRE